MTEKRPEIDRGTEKKGYQSSKPKTNLQNGHQGSTSQNKPKTKPSTRK